MPISNTKLKLSLTSLELDCPDCEAEDAKVIRRTDSFHVECSHCGAQGFRYEKASYAIRDWPKFRGRPTIIKRKRQA